jgi:ligand-binding sensor domain-containing protein
MPSLLSLRTFIILIALLPLYTAAQTNYLFQHLTIEDGLSANARVNGFQDSRGYYWFSSIYSLQRFDGKNFVSFPFPENGDKNSLAEWFGKPLEDKNANIWIVNEEGASIYLRQHQVMVRAYNADIIDSNINNVVAILNTPQHELLQITSRSLFSYNDRQEKSKMLYRILNEPADHIMRVAHDAGSTDCWLLLSKKRTVLLARFNYQNKKIDYQANPDLNQLINSKEIALFKMDLRGNLWLADYAGNLYRFNPLRNEFKHYPILIEKEPGKFFNSGYFIHDFLDDGNGSIWFGGEGSGLLKYDIKEDSFTRIHPDNGTQFGLHLDETIYSFFKDRENNIWIDTDLGMNIFNPAMQRFRYVNPFPAIPADFNANILSIFESSSKDIWIGSSGYGVFQFDSNFVFRKRYIHEPNNPASLGEPLNRAWSFGEDNKKRIWVGCQSGILSILDLETGKFTNKTVPEFSQSTIMHISHDSLDNFWFGLYNGKLGKFNVVGSKFSVYPFSYADNQKAATIIDGILIKGKKVYVSTSMNGLRRFDSQRDTADELINPGQHVFTINAMNDSLLLGGTAGKGLFIHNENSGQTRFINTRKGLRSNIIYGVFPVDANNIWIIANNGIDRIDLTTEKIFHYGSNEGIKDHVILKAFCRLKNGVFLVAANSGIIYFNPDSIKANPPPPDVQITDFHTEQRNYSVDSLASARTLQLPFTENGVTIEYASLSFAGRKTAQYFYQLQGIDRNWVDAGVRRSVAFANLSPGTYLFQVKARNADGVESVHNTRISFTIYPPWWRTVWAYLLWFGLIGGILFIFYDYRNRHRKILSGVRQGIASDLHDDIGSTLNSISVYSEIAIRDLEQNPENSRLLLAKMGYSSRNMIDTMNDIVWAINPDNDNFMSTLLRMQYFAGELLSGKNILLQFIAEENVKFKRLSIRERKNLYLIFKEAINNIYKYSDCKTVNVTISVREQNVLMIITDDGKGFELTGRTNAGNGLANMHLRAKEISARVTIQSWPMKGTRIELEVPN